mmetsp:Transcript_20835/g.70948  ORF Transcript_20835/g.70948 Transcript_20835/m.70948 type:complete len:223 (-) Transcript_20835:182-850(-)
MAAVAQARVSGRTTRARRTVRASAQPARRVAAAATEEATGSLKAKVFKHDLIKEGLGQDLMNTTYMPKAVDYAKGEKVWVKIDAEGQVLGRLGTLAAEYLRGKNVPTYTQHADMGCQVVVVNAEKVVVSGKKYTEKMYIRHRTGAPGTLKKEAFDKLQKRIPERIVEKAVKGMLPKGALGRELFRNLHVYKGPEHPHAAQEPKDVTEEVDVPTHTEKSWVNQ